MHTSIFRPNFSQATQMFHQCIDRHAQDLYHAKLHWHEHKDGEGQVYQLTPFVEMWFKGFAG